MPAVTAPANATEAMAMARAGLSYLAAADPTALTAAEQAQCLIELEQLDATGTAARAWILAAFTAARGYEADADRSARIWLVRKTGVTDGAAAGHVGWARRTCAHPRVMAALAARQVTESMARLICAWTDRLPEADRDRADEILLGVARAGARQQDIARLGAEMYERSRSAAPDEDGPDGGFDDRSVTLETTFEGAGVLAGRLTPECAALVGTVLDALSQRAGPEDTRTREQRWHDGLEDAMRRLAASGLVPDRAGQPVRALAHMSLAGLRAMDEGSKLEDEWAARAREEWAGHRAAVSVTGGDGSAWLDGQAARAIACDACLVPVVTGDPDLGVLDRLVGLCVELAGHGHGRCQPAPGDAAPGNGTQQNGTTGNGTTGSRAPGSGTPGGPLTARAREMLQRAIIGAAADLMSGPGGLASYLRTRQLGARLAGPSLPLDVGATSTIPAAIRTALIVRSGGHCEWPGGCAQPAAACHVHHLTRRADGGTTSVTRCALLCSFHHLVAVHRWGWTLILNPDGTTTARSPDGTKELNSHGPPPRPG